MLEMTVEFLREADVLQLTYSVIPPQCLIQRRTRAHSNTYMVQTARKQALSFDRVW